MAITVSVFGPANELPQVAMGNFQWLRLVGDGTQVINAAGFTLLSKVVVTVAGTAAAFYDTPAGGTADNTTLLTSFNASTAGLRFEGIVCASRGLTVITTGAALDMLIEFYGRGSVASSRNFGVA